MSDGRIQIEHFYAGELVKTTEMDAALKAGTIQLAFTSGVMYKGTAPIGWLAGCSLPAFIWESFAELSELYHQRGLDELMREGWAERGIHYLNTLGDGQIFFWANRPIYGVDDLKGLKVRFYGGLSDIMEAFGASPVYLPHEETYMAISQGTLDASGTSYHIYEGLGLYEVAPYLIGPPWKLPEEMCIMISLDAFNALPDDLKEIVKTAGILLAHETAVRCEADQKVMFRKLDGWGSTYIEWGPEDVAKVKEVSLELLDEIATEIGPQDPRVATGLEIIKDFMRETEG